MTTRGSLDFRSEIGRCLEAFTRGEIDFQVLLAAVDRITAENPAARAEAVTGSDPHETTGALQRTFFRVLRERLVNSDGSEGSVALQPPEPSAPAAPTARPLEPAPNSHRFEPPDPIRAFELAGRIARPDRNIPFEPARRSEGANRTMAFDLSARPEPADPGEPVEPIAQPDPLDPAPTPQVDPEPEEFRTKPFELAPEPAAETHSFEPVEPPAVEAPLDATMPFELAGRPEPVDPPPPVALEEEPEPSDRTVPFELPGRLERSERPEPRETPESPEPPAEITRAPAKKPRIVAPEERFVSRRRVGEPAVESADEDLPAPPPAAGARIPPQMPPMRAQPTPGLVEPRSFITERRTPLKSQSQPLAWAGAFLIVALLLGLVWLGPLDDVFPRLKALVTREVPVLSKEEAAQTPEEAGEKAVEAAPPAEEPAPPAAAGNAPPATNGPIAPGSATGTAKEPGPSSASCAASPAPETPPSPATETPQPAAQATAPSPQAQTRSNPSAEQATTPTAETKPQASTATVAEGEAAAAPAGPGRFAFGARAYTVREGKGVVAIAILRHDGSQGAVNITWWTTPESAKPGDDYADFGYRTESFANGEMQRVIHVPIASDDIVEPRKTFTVHITNATNGAQLESPTTATVTIVDDD
jgi:hypothetical protein